MLSVYELITGAYALTAAAVLASVVAALAVLSVLAIGRNRKLRTALDNQQAISANANAELVVMRATLAATELALARREATLQVVLEDNASLRQRLNDTRAELNDALAALQGEP